MSEKQLYGTQLKLQNIFCIGRNYSEHAKELNNPIPTNPVVFIKPTSSVCYDGESIIIPRQSKNVHHEIEVVVVIGRNGKNIDESDAHNYISHIGVGLDLTARDLQDFAKEKSLPWTISKGFDTFSALSRFHLFDGKPETLKNIEFELKINGEIRQSGNTSGMIFSIPYIVSYLSSVFTLSPGDIIYTGTPSGVGPLKAGDKIKGQIKDMATLSLNVQSEQ